MLKITKPLVSVNWLQEHLDKPNLVILDATIKKVTATENTATSAVAEQIKDARFLDIKNKFSDTSAAFPNTMLSAKQFSEAARALGINNESAIVVYDTIGIYSSPRVWWMFKAMGHDNVAVLDGGFPEWKKAGLPCEKQQEYKGDQGNFIANYREKYLYDYKDMLSAVGDKHVSIIDARSEERFNGTVAEPREGLRSGHIPNAVNMPFATLMENEKMKSNTVLTKIFNELKIKDSIPVFSCGSGITACILALGAEIAGIQNKAVYDGSWTEWGSLNDV